MSEVPRHGRPSPVRAPDAGWDASAVPGVRSGYLVAVGSGEAASEAVGLAVAPSLVRPCGSGVSVSRREPRAWYAEPAERPVNRTERRAWYADRLGWTVPALGQRAYRAMVAAAERSSADFRRFTRRLRRKFRRSRTPGATARSRRLACQRAMQANRRARRNP